MAEGGTSGSNFHKVLGRGLTDDKFRSLMDSKQRAQALRSMGIEPTEEVLEALDGAIAAMNRLAQSKALGGDQTRRSPRAEAWRRRHHGLMRSAARIGATGLRRPPAERRSEPSLPSGKLLEYDLAIRYSESGQFRDVFLGASQVQSCRLRPGSSTMSAFPIASSGIGLRATCSGRHSSWPAAPTRSRVSGIDTRSTTPTTLHSSSTSPRWRLWSLPGAIPAGSPFWAQWASISRDELEREKRAKWSRKQRRPPG